MRERQNQGRTVKGLFEGRDSFYYHYQGEYKWVRGGCRSKRGNQKNSRHVTLFSRKGGKSGKAVEQVNHGSGATTQAKENVER